MNNVLAKSTIHGYKGAIRRYQDFCEAENYDRTIISEKSISHYLTHLHKNNVTIACVNQVRLALSLMIEMYGGDVSIHAENGSLDQHGEAVSGQKKIANAESWGGHVAGLEGHGGQSGDSIQKFDFGDSSSSFSYSDSIGHHIIYFLSTVGLSRVES
jgi:hypothetical protein